MYSYNTALDEQDSGVSGDSVVSYMDYNPIRSYGRTIHERDSVSVRSHERTNGFGDSVSVQSGHTGTLFADLVRISFEKQSFVSITICNDNNKNYFSIK